MRQIERDEKRGSAADTIVTGCINPPSWYPQGRASNPKVNALDSHRPPSASSSTSSLTSFSGPFPLPLRLAHTSFFLSRFHRCPLLLRSSRSRSRVRWRISSGHERDVTAINPADTALARVGRASGRLPHFLLLFLSLSLPSSFSSSLSRSFSTFCCFFFFYSFDLTTSASRTE